MSRDGNDLITDHPYYCCEGNFYQRGHHEHLPSWSRFVVEWSEEDEDMNLLYRWDITRDDDGALTLKCFYMHQRKARCSSVFVDITEADLPTVREWLEGKWSHICKLWAPLSDNVKGGE